MACRSALYFSTEVTSFFKIISLHNFSSCPFLFLQFPFLFRVWFVIEAVWKSAFNSITLSTDLKRMARDDSFSMSMYARPGVSFFNLCHYISAAFLTASQNRTSLPPSLCFVTYFNWASGGPQIHMRGSRTGWRSDIFHYCFDFFSRAKPKQKILKFLQKGILYRAPSLVITPCSYQSFICHWAVGIKIAIVFAQHLVRRRETSVLLFQRDRRKITVRRCVHICWK